MLTPEQLAALPGLLEAVGEYEAMDMDGFHAEDIHAAYQRSEDAADNLRALAPALARAVLAAEAEKERLRETGRANANIAGQLRAYVRAVEEWGLERREGGPDERAKSKAMDSAWNGILRSLAAYREAGEGRDG